MWPRYFIFIISCWSCLVSTTLADNSSNTKAPLILVMGDSLSAGFGIDQSRGWVNLLAKRLETAAYPHRIFNASISGETSQGGLNRLPNALKQKPSIVVIELGANDGLRGLSLEQLRNNLEKMIILSQQAGAKILLIGMQMPPNYGPAYTNGFHHLYLELAKKYNVSLAPFLLDNVATHRELMQGDNLHPTAEAQPALLDNVWSYLLPLL